MKFSLWAASLALITSYAVAQNEFFPYTLDMEWSSDAKADDCKASDRAAIDEKIFTHVNRVLSDSQYTTYKSLQIETQRRSLENEDRELCNGTKMCSRYCRYNWRVCNKLYNCGCRGRRDLSEPIYLAAGERELAELKAQLASACQAALTPSSVKDKKCKDAMDTASCTVDLFGYESGNMANEFFPYTMDMEWKSDKYDSSFCNATDRSAVNQDIFINVNTVLSSENYMTYKKLFEEKMMDRSLRGSRELCNGTKMCTRYCKYNWRVCNKLYNCGCRGRRNRNLELAYLHLPTGERELADLETELREACQDAVDYNSLQPSLTAPSCKTALQDAKCEVTLEKYMSPRSTGVLTIEQKLEKEWTDLLLQQDKEDEALLSENQNETNGFEKAKDALIADQAREEKDLTIKQEGEKKEMGKEMGDLLATQATEEANLLNKQATEQSDLSKEFPDSSDFAKELKKLEKAQEKEKSDLLKQHEKAKKDLDKSHADLLKAQVKALKKKYDDLFKVIDKKLDDLSLVERKHESDLLKKHRQEQDDLEKKHKDMLKKTNGN